MLTVGETEGYASRGVMIRFLTEKNRLRFEINLEAATSANLKISSKLLRAVQIIGPERK